jgi:hypothetical protein
MSRDPHGCRTVRIRRSEAIYPARRLRGIAASQSEIDVLFGERRIVEAERCIAFFRLVRVGGAILRAKRTHHGV